MRPKSPSDRKRREWSNLAIVIVMTVASVILAAPVPSNSRRHAVALTAGLAAGPVLAMPVDTMIPEAYSVANAVAGLITVARFLVGIALSKGIGV